MQLNWIIGTEGSGHFMLRSLLRRHLAKETTVDKGDYYPLLEQRWRPESSRLPRALVRQELDRIVRAYKQLGVTHIYEDTSFPFGPSRSVLTRPDIVDFLSLFEGICNISIILLYREPMETTYSALRRGFSDSLATECLITESCHQQISSQITSLAGVQAKTLEFEAFLSDREAFLRPLAQWLNVATDDFDLGACDPARPVKAGGIPNAARIILDEYFRGARNSQWEGFYKDRRFDPSGEDEDAREP